MLNRTNEAGHVPACRGHVRHSGPRPGGAQAGPEPRPPPQSPGCDRSTRAPRGMPGASRLLGPLTVAGLMVTMGEVAVVTTTAVRLSGDLALNNGPAKWG